MNNFVGDPALIADTIDVLSDIRAAQANDARWREIAEVLEIALDALAAGDAEQFREAAADLSDLGPTRVTRVGSPSRTAAPPTVRERIDRLVHALGAAPATNDGRPQR